MKLSTPTNRTTAGPALSSQDDRLTVIYEYEHEDGSIDQGIVEFTEVIAFRFWQEPSSPPENVVGAMEVREQDASSYLAEVVKRWDQAVGWQSWQQEQGGSRRFKHHTMFFDDAGSLDVISAACLARQ